MQAQSTKNTWRFWTYNPFTMLWWLVVAYSTSRLTLKINTLPGATSGKELTIIFSRSKHVCTFSTTLAPGLSCENCNSSIMNVTMSELLQKCATSERCSLTEGQVILLSSCQSLSLTTGRLKLNAVQFSIHADRHGSALHNLGRGLSNMLQKLDGSTSLLLALPN